MRLIDADALKKAMTDYEEECGDIIPKKYFDFIDNAPTVKPCENCDLYFKAMTKEEMKKGEAECILVDELDNMPMIYKKHKGGIVPRGTHHQKRSNDNDPV